MTLRAVKASAPGSLMLMGEHAVLRGQPAIVCAISKRLKVALTPREDQAVRLHSVLGEHETTLEELAPNDSFRFVLAAIVLLVALRMALGLGWQPDEIYTVTPS